jgi:hypothetical protein
MRLMDVWVHGHDVVVASCSDVSCFCVCVGGGGGACFTANASQLW